MKYYKHFIRKDNKYIDDNGNVVATDEIMKLSHQIIGDEGFIEINHYQKCPKCNGHGIVLRQTLNTFSMSQERKL